MNCLPCGGSTIAAIRPVKDTIDVNGGEEMPISDGVDVPIPVPREKEFGLRNPRKLKDPRLPSRREMDEHSLAAHMPYRSWCTFCVMGKGKTTPCHKQYREDGLPELHVDYCFMSTKGKPLATILVAKEKMSKMMLATVVPLKGASVEFPVKRCLAFLKEIGLEGSDIVLKSDQENSVKDVLNVLASRRLALSKLEPHRSESGIQSASPGVGVGRSIIEASPVASSGSNGFIERGIQSMEGQTRTIKLAFESNIGETIPSDHNVVPWIVEYAAVSINRGQVSSDGKTAYERLKAKPANLAGLEFGERLLWKEKIAAKNRRFKMDSDWKHGVFLGQRTLSGEYIVGTMEGIVRPRAIHRRPIEERWKSNLEFVTGLPWRLRKEDDGDVEVFLDENAPEPSLEPLGSPLPPIMLEEPVVKQVRSFYVKKTDVDPSKNGIGFTPGCPGCLAIINRSSHSVAHGEGCRLRVMERAKTDSSVASRAKTTQGKDLEAHAKLLEATEEKRKRKAAPNSMERPSEGTGVEEEGSAGAARNEVGGASGSGSSVPVSSPEPGGGSSSSGPASSPAPRKRQAESQAEPEVVQDQGLQEAATAQPDAGMDQNAGEVASPLSLARPDGVKRMGEDYPQDGYQTIQESKQQRIGMLDVIVENLEESIPTIRTLDYELPMATCEEKVDLSYLENLTSDLLEEAVARTNVGGVCLQLDDQIASCMMQSLCPGEEGESIFDPGSRMGLEEDCEEDRWEYDASNASWTRFIVVPRKDFFHPSEGAGEESSGPKLSDLRNCRWTFPEGIAAIKDDWKKDSGELEVDGSPMEWTGNCVSSMSVGLQKKRRTRKKVACIWKCKEWSECHEAAAKDTRHPVRCVR